MSDAGSLEDFLAGACVDAAVFALRPDYRAVLVAVGGLVPGPGDQDSDALLAAAEAAARRARAGPAQVLVDHHHLVRGPAQPRRALPQVVLPGQALGMDPDLQQRGLADIRTHRAPGVTR
jgi:hypothetical protein